MSWDSSILWLEARRMPDTVANTLEGAVAAIDEATELIAESDRVVFTGNGASLFAAIGGWIEAASGPRRPTPLWVPAGLLADRSISLGPADLVVAVSTSGELRDLVELSQHRSPPQLVALTAYPNSTIGTAAKLVVPLSVRSQKAVTHTQAYASATSAALLFGTLVGGLTLDADRLFRLPDTLRASIERAEDWLKDPALPTCTSVVCAGSGRSWPAALQAALMVREIAGIPAEGVEAREAITSSLAVLGPTTLMVIIGGRQDAATSEVAITANATGSPVLVIDAIDTTGAQLGAFPMSLALAIVLGLRAGRDLDQPSWYSDYLAVARQIKPE